MKLLKNIQKQALDFPYKNKMLPDYDHNCKGCLQIQWILAS